jgi:hypothetical protein
LEHHSHHGGAVARAHVHAVVTREEGHVVRCEVAVVMSCLACAGSWILQETLLLDGRAS